MSATAMTNAEDRQYRDGRRCGSADFRSGSDYRPGPGSPMWRQGYCDGWSSAADAADITAAQERERARIDATEYASLGALLAEFD